VSLTGIAVGEQYWRDSNRPGAGASPIPAQIAAVTVLDAAAEYTVLPHVTLTSGVGNLTDRVYYNRVVADRL
jgi:outer membrane receptor protein involved in Fe transport